jgi:hypothetical protein
MRAEPAKDEQTPIGEERDLVPPRAGGWPVVGTDSNCKITMWVVLRSVLAEKDDRERIGREGQEKGMGTKKNAPSRRGVALASTLDHRDLP